MRLRRSAQGMGCANIIADLAHGGLQATRLSSAASFYSWSATMRKDRDAVPDPSQPSLIVTYGNTTRKVRPLDREVLVLGRAGICDVNLVSPEIANIHCVIVHVQKGWRVRDC